MPSLSRIVLVALAAGAATAVQAAEPVRHIAIFVTPYYEAAASPGALPKVSVGATFNALLASTRRDFRAQVLTLLRESCASEEEFEREARGLFG